MRIIAFLLIASSLQAASPDWPRVERHALDLLERYIRIRSIDPPANTAEAARFFQAELEKNGFAPALYTSGPGGQTDLVVRLAGRERSKKALLLLNHFDVVPVDPRAWSVDPFAAIVQGGFLWGRGAYDMKGIGIQQLTTLILLKQLGIVPARDIVMLSTADEESSGIYGVQWMIAHHWEDLNPEYVLDEGGLVSREMLAPGKLVFGVSVGEKQAQWLRLTAKGTSGHASQPIPDNANVILLDAIQKAMALPRAARVNPVVAEMRHNIGGVFVENKFTAAIQKNTISLTTLSSGVGSPPKVNVIPSTAEATLDCRLLPGVNASEFVSELTARINDPRVTVVKLTSPVDPGSSNSRTPLFEAIRRAALAAHPDAVVTPMLVPFSTDSVYLRRRGAIAYGFTPMVLDAATAATMHSDQERIPVDEFRKGLHIFFDVLRSNF